MQVPNNPEVEEAVLGAVLIDPSIFPHLVGILKPEDFFVERNRWVWHAMSMLDKEGKEIDVLTVVEQLRKQKQLEQIGGEARVVHLVNATPTSVHAFTYAKMLLATSQRRRALRAAEEIARGVHDDSRDVLDVVGAGISALVGALRGIARAHKSDVSPLLEDFEERLENPKEIWGVRTGFADYDYAFGGLHGGEVLLVAGAPGAGKSVLCGQMAAQIAGIPYYEPQELNEEPVPVAIYTMEMSEQLYQKRIVSGIARVDTRVLDTGFVPEERLSAIYHAHDLYDAAPIYVSDDADMTTLQLRADVGRMVNNHGVRVVIIDYLMLLRDEAPTDRAVEEQISRNIKNMAREYDVAVVAVQSMTKEGMKQVMADLTSMRGSGQMLHDADNVTYLGADEGSDYKIIWYPKKARNAAVNKMMSFYFMKPEKVMLPWDLTTAQDMSKGEPKRRQGEIPF